MKPAHLVTGATGFVGGAIVLELIERTDLELVCLVRPGDEDDPRGRFEHALRRATRVYDRDELLEDALARCHVVGGDLTRPLCGVAADDLPPVSDVWHSAASLAFEDESEDEIMLQNVAGTQEVMKLARAAGAEAFNYVSTAYVAGNREGVIEEELPSSTETANNAYERSKIRAEGMVAEAPFERVRIMRPSIVIGHSRTCGATTFTGMYGFARNLRDLRREVNKRVQGFLAVRPLRLHADPTVPLNLIPIDTVARNAVRIGMSDTTDVIFHLTNATCPPVGEVISVMTDALGLRTPRYVDNPREFTSIDEEVDDRLDFYGSYIRSHKHFDRTHADAVTGPDAADEPLPRERLVDYIDWFFEYLEQRRRARKAALGAGVG